MAKKRTRRYGDYTQIIKGELYAVVNLRQPDGKYKKKYKKVDSRTDALQWALNQLDKHRKAETYDDALAFSEFADWYKQEFLHEPHYEKGLKVSGVKDYERLKNKVDRFKEFFGQRPLKEFSEYDLHRWIKKRRSEVSTATINRDLSLLRTMFKKGLRFRKILAVPNFELNTAGEIARDRVMTKAEEKAVLAACVDKETIKKSSRRQKEYETEIEAKRAHLKPIILLAVDTAMRKGEILALRWSDVDFEAEIIKIRSHTTKSQKAREVGMTPRVKESLENIPRESDKIFPFKDIKRAFLTACARAGIKDLHFHDLRHTAITRMIRAGIPHTEVMKISGHTQMKTFLRYLNIQPDAIKNASQKLAEFLENSE